MRRKAHVRFGGRSEETGWLKGQNRASLRSNFIKVRDNGRVVSQAIVVAIGVTASGEREVLGLDVGPSESGAFWLAFLRGLVTRGLSGVRLVISDAHSGLKMAIASILQGAVWQRRRVHFVRDAFALVPKHAQQMVATIRTVFVQPDAASARTTWRTVGESFRGRFPRPTAMLTEAEDDVLAYANFPSAHWHQVWSTDEIVKVAA